MISKKFYSLLMIVYLIFIFTIFSNFGFGLVYIKTVNNQVNLETSASTDPDSPSPLRDDIRYTATYFYSNDYYYKTYNMNSFKYHLIWLYSVDYTVNLNLYLYSSSNYSSSCLIESSTSWDNVDWIIYRPSTSNYKYLKVESKEYGGREGIIEVGSGLSGSMDNSYTVCSTSQEIGDIYEFNLDSGHLYTISLIVPTDTNLDLYACYLPDGESANYDEYNYESTSDILGNNEEITFRPSTSGVWALVIIKKGGTGSGTLTITENSLIPSFEFMPVLSALILAIYISMLFLKRKPKLFKNF